MKPRDGREVRHALQHGHVAHGSAPPLRALKQGGGFVESCALGLQATATDAAVESTVRRLLRLLHPDYAINLSIKDTRQHERIEAAFKRLNCLRDETIRL